MYMLGILGGALNVIFETNIVDENTKALKTGYVIYLTSNFINYQKITTLTVTLGILQEIEENHKIFSSRFARRR